MPLVAGKRLVQGLAGDDLTSRHDLVNGLVAPFLRPGCGSPPGLDRIDPRPSQIEVPARLARVTVQCVAAIVPGVEVRVYASQ